MTTLLGVASLAAFADGETGGGLALGATAGLFLASAVRGNNAANDCRAALEQYDLAYRSGEGQQPFAREREDDAPRPAMVKQKLAKKPAKTAAKMPVEEAAAQPEIVQSDPVQQQQLDVEQKEPATAPEYATPRPSPTKPSKADPPKKPKPASGGDEDWSVFWKEAP